jgi:hypothetical protein
MLVAWENQKRAQFSVCLFDHIVDGTLREKSTRLLVGVVTEVYWPKDKKVYPAKILAIGNYQTYGISFRNNPICDFFLSRY